MIYTNEVKNIGIKVKRMSEIITINFLPSEEGITWKRRKPHSIHTKKEVVKKSTAKREPEMATPQDYDNGIMVFQEVPEIKKPKPNELLYIKEVTEKVRLLVRKAIVNNKNPDEKNTITHEINALESDLKEHRDYFCNLELSTQYIKMINDLIHLKYKFVYNTKINHQTTTKTNNKTKSILIQTNSEKGDQVGKRLSALKKQVKKKNLSDEEKRTFLKELADIITFIENNKNDFTKTDNIPGRLKQIEQYKNILNGIPNIPKKNKTTTESIITSIETQQKKKFKVILRKHSL